MGRPKDLVGRDWYALGLCLLLMALGQNGGKRISHDDAREVLIPVPEDEIAAVLRVGVHAGRLTAECSDLIESLTAKKYEERAGPNELRSCEFLQETFAQLEQL